MNTTPSIQKTLVFIKPDGIENWNMGKVITELENHRINIVGVKMLHLQKTEAEQFYAVHKGRGFYDSLVTYVSRGKILAMVLKGENVIAKCRELMGATNPANADKNTIRGKYGTSLDANVVHGSDSPEAAEQEISFFFSRREIQE